MLLSTIRRIWASKPKLSLAFWTAFALLYAIGFFAIIVFINPLIDEALLALGAPHIVSFKLNLIRLPIICLVLLALPYLLWSSLARALLLMKFATAVSIVIYIDDYLVLYEIVGYPKLAIFKIALFLRPIAIMAVLWITFELQFRVKIGQHL